MHHQLCCNPTRDCSLLSAWSLPILSLCSHCLLLIDFYKHVGVIFLFIPAKKYILRRFHCSLFGDSARHVLSGEVILTRSSWMLEKRGDKPLCKRLNNLSDWVQFPLISLHYINQLNNFTEKVIGSYGRRGMIAREERRSLTAVGQRRGNCCLWSVRGLNRSLLNCNFSYLVT